MSTLTIEDSTLGKTMAPWIGVDRQVGIDRRQRGLHDPRAQARGRMRMDGAVNPDDFLAHQVRAGEAA